jgi:hypothetical protein
MAGQGLKVQNNFGTWHLAPGTWHLEKVLDFFFSGSTPDDELCFL